MSAETVPVATWPHWYGPNRYIQLFQSAIAPYGFDHLPGVDLDARAMWAAGARIAHLHWAEWAWQSRGRFGLRQRLGIRSLERFLDQAAECDLPVIWTVHNLESHEPSGMIDSIGFGLLHRRVRLRIFHSRSALASAQLRYPGAGEVCLMPHGNYDGVFPAPRRSALVRSELGISGNGQRLLLMAGNIRRYKGVTQALDALRTIAGGSQRYHLLVAGRKGAGIGRELSAADRGAPGVTVIPRLVSDQEMSDLHAAADAVLLPYSHVTGSGALLAALTLGRGIITTAHEYFSELLATDSRAGVVASANTAGGLALAIERFFELDPAVRGSAARGIADRFSWPVVARPVAERMRELAGV